ncbi:MAG: ABC transporter permease [Chloroflexi bacterium]|nr:ABC transporter permease [Chloroflexota bacterium]
MTTPNQRWHFERQLEVTPWAGVIARLVAIGLGLLVGGLFIQLTGRPALALGQKVLQSILGSAVGLEQAGILATPLILTGLSVAVGLRMRLWNIGAEGQLFMGAWAATGIGIHLVNGPAPVMLAAMFIAGAAAGALWMLIPALARAYANVNEIITTLMLNFVAILLVTYFAIGPWRDLTVGILSASYRVPYELPLWFGSLHIGIFMAVLAAIALSVIMGNTRWGYELATIGGNRRAAEFAGIPVTRHILIVMLLSGAIAGIAGVVEVTGTAHRLSGTISNEYGFLGIIVAALANGSPLGVIPTGFLLAVLLNGGIVLQAQGLSVNAVLALTGLILLFAAIGEVTSRYRLVRASPIQAEQAPVDQSLPTL